MIWMLLSVFWSLPSTLLPRTVTLGTSRQSLCLAIPVTTNLAHRDKLSSPFSSAPLSSCDSLKAGLPAVWGCRDCRKKLARLRRSWGLQRLYDRETVVKICLRKLVRVVWYVFCLLWSLPIFFVLLSSWFREPGRTGEVNLFSTGCCGPPDKHVYNVVA